MSDASTETRNVISSAGVADNGPDGFHRRGREPRSSDDAEALLGLIRPIYVMRAKGALSDAEFGAALFRMLGLSRGCAFEEPAPGLSAPSASYVDSHAIHPSYPE